MARLLIREIGKILPLLHVREEQPAGVSAGTSLVGINYRKLNTVVTNTIVGASLTTVAGFAAGNSKITLPLGTYRIKFRSPMVADSNYHKVLFYNITDDSIVHVGSSCYGPVTPSIDCVGEFRLLINGTKDFELRHYSSGTQANYGLGIQTNDLAVINNVYAEVWIEKEL